MDTFRIILYIVIAIIIILLIYAKIYNDIKTRLLKINSVENEMDASLRLKYDLIVKIIAELGDTKDFDDVEEIKDEELSSFEFSRRLYDIEMKIYSIKSESNKLSKSTSFNDLWYKITNLNSKISGEEKYYNENTTKYNALISRFPSNIVANIMRLKEKKYFDGKDMFDQNTKDFKI